MFRYIVPFPVLDRWLDTFVTTEAGNLDIPYNDFIAMVRRLIEPSVVDEDWYVATYPAIGDRIAKGVFASSYHHYLAHGYFESRLPFAPDSSAHRPPVPFRDIRNKVPVRPSRSGLRVAISKAELMNILKKVLSAVPVDEAWYRTTYRGVAEAIDRGGFSSASSHYALHGYQESRWPFAMEVDSDWYLSRYPDVRQILGEGDAASAQDHYWRAGYREGRFPGAAPVS
jgi:hypothetical protein